PRALRTRAPRRVRRSAPTRRCPRRRRPARGRLAAPRRLRPRPLLLRRHPLHRAGVLEAKAEAGQPDSDEDRGPDGAALTESPCAGRGEGPAGAQIREKGEEAAPVARRWRYAGGPP